MRANGIADSHLTGVEPANSRHAAVLIVTQIGDQHFQRRVEIHFWTGDLR